MGVEWADCRVVAELIGLKTFLNEFVAYGVMGEYIRNRETGEGPTLSVGSTSKTCNRHYRVCGTKTSISMMTSPILSNAPSC